MSCGTIRCSARSKVKRRVMPWESWDRDPAIGSRGEGYAECEVPGVDIWRDGWCVYEKESGIDCSAQRSSGYESVDFFLLSLEASESPSVSTSN